ncbi:protein kinase [Nocardia puris]|uniref:serine/threonine-protein kinase n=1 Tax=Nocardia puris TaxID=208602 RepID=UPI00189431BD|nr:serine/threonine-protein kinase [Nocardia puris]MBF6210258.1 protein kinase [Nocardia puris]MBF6367334.1 protein kinase [Nocardia puris]MBF6457519.1 protein kinase [Nocardia puris]
MRPLGLDDPRWIGDYRILGVLGAGGMGKVYLGRNTGGRTVAVKVIRPDLVGDTEFRARFRREVAAAQRVGGRFTAPVLDADVDADPPWLATGYVAGFALSEAVETFGPFGEDTLLALARGLAAALVAVHEAGVVHRDLKPSNVLLAVDGPKVIDFGIARAVEDTALTTTGKVVGSPGFMCPEQVTGEPVGPASDVFALGGVLTFAATGQGPFGTGETMHLLWRIVYEDPRLDAVPERLRPIVASCLAKDPAARPAPARLLDVLGALGAPERTGWLPPAVLEEVSVRAVRLLDLDSGPLDLPTHPATGGTPARPHTNPGPQGFPNGTQQNSYSSGSHHTPPPTTSGYAPGPYAGGPGPQAGYQQSSHFAPQHNSVDQRANHFSPQHNSVDQPGYGQRPPAKSKRGPLLAALAVVAVLVAAGAYVIGTQLRDNDSGPSAADTTTQVTTSAESTTTTTTTAATTTAAAAASAVPSALVGTWRGTVADPIFTFDLEITIREGAVGDEVATSANTGRLSGTRCGRAERLTAATENSITLVARLTENPGTCVDEGSTSTVTLQPDGTVRYTTPGLAGAMEGTLTKS